MLAFWSSVFLLWRFQFRIWFVTSDLSKCRSKLETFNWMYYLFWKVKHAVILCYYIKKHGKEVLELYPAGLSLLFPSGLIFQPVRRWYNFKEEQGGSSRRKLIYSFCISLYSKTSLNPFKNAKSRSSAIGFYSKSKRFLENFNQRVKSKSHVIWTILVEFSINFAFSALY